MNQKDLFFCNIKLLNFTNITKKKLKIPDKENEKDRVTE